LTQAIPQVSSREERASEEEVGRKTTGGWKAELRYALHLARKNPLVLVGSVIALGSLLLGLISPLLVAPDTWKHYYRPYEYCWNNPSITWPIVNLKTQCGSQIFPLGTDAYGRDLLKMIIQALPTDLEISLTIVLSAVALGVTLGAVAAYAGGITDEAILRITDIFFAFPGLVLAIVIVTVLGHTLTNLTIAVLIVWWPLYVRLIRSQILSEKEKPYAEALRSMGASRIRILFRHIVPNSIYPVLVQLTLDIGGVILTFSSLMFLGFSPSPIFPELGNLVNEGIQEPFTAPWLIIFPGLTILIVALGFNLLGDGVRDILDPRLRR
jgi:peptide/nickel transport system permease protein